MQSVGDVDDAGAHLIEKDGVHLMLEASGASRPSGLPTARTLGSGRALVTGVDGRNGDTA